LGLHPDHKAGNPGASFGGRFYDLTPVAALLRLLIDEMMTSIKAVCVYCGSRFGNAEAFSLAAESLGRALARQGVQLVYGGGAVGLMGIVARAAMAEGGHVTGIIPDHLYKREVGLDGLDELLVVDTMHTRKAEMVARSDAFIILPGGIGTLDEMMEILTWRQLELHDKPVILIDIDGYWQPIAKLFDHVIDAGFLQPQAHAYYTLVPDVAGALGALGLAAP
jgi:uncharacterized protein (TIGR00730 family)